jgi:hypothetical protein
MDEHEWLTSTDPAAMLEALRDPLSPNMRRLGAAAGSLISPRKLRLFACAVCRAVWDGTPCPKCHGEGKYLYGEVVHFTDYCDHCGGTGRVGGITDPRSRRAVEVAEAFADGAATREEMEQACMAPEIFEVGSFANAPMFLHKEPVCQAVINNVLNNAGEYRSWPEGSPAAQADLLRCVVGNPFRPVQRWRFAPGDGITLATPTVLTLARAAYADRDWGLLPYLADALEESGCTNADLLAHLRGPGPFCRGDWAVDLLLAKE